MFQSISWAFIQQIKDGIDNSSMNNDIEMQDLDQYEGIDRLYVQEDVDPPPRGGYEAVRVYYRWYLASNGLIDPWNP